MIRIIPIRGLNIRGHGHADAGEIVSCDDAQARELVGLRVAHFAPHETAPATPVIETAAAAPAPETAAVRRKRTR
jgi:hypothetical protein